MALVAIALDDVGLAVRLQEILETAGHNVSWDAALASGPPHDIPHSVEVILLPAGDDIRNAIDKWRDSDPPPAILLIGQSAQAEHLAGEVKAVYVQAVSAETDIAGAIERALEFRHAARMSREYARSACGLGRADDPTEDAIRILRGSRRVDIALVREALRSHVTDYAAADPEMIKLLRHHRALEIPEVEFTHTLDGARTVNTAVNSGKMTPARSAQALWALVSIGAVGLSPEPPDVSTLKRRAVVTLRHHIRARHRRLMTATIYDVLEVPQGASRAQIAHAARMLSSRYAKERLAAIDLGDLAPMVQPMWEQIDKSLQILCDDGARRQYDEGLAAREPDQLSPWAGGRGDDKAAQTFYQRGQRALVAGDAFKAVSELAAACRAYEDHPVYEVTLAWMRYRAELSRGKAPESVAPKERAIADQFLAGRRPWPGALVPLAMLCAADNDADAARWHLREALTCDPNLPAARQLLARLTRRAAL